ncbi:MAG: TonB-dependent receptor [Bacteroidales bacterium]|nr:TonB-dependent receptor [Bacteroidales bacterium]
MVNLKLIGISAILIIIVVSNTDAQNITQSVRRQVIENQTQATLPGATVILLESDPVIATITDNNGYFLLENIPIGRISLQISYVGFNTVLFSNLNLTSGKELVLNIEMEEMIEKIDEVVITAFKKGETINQLASISARTFSIEESQRYAGARNDVSKMASNYAGVCSSNDALNDIVIRGNSPSGLLWRLEGVDIPNPNHFGQLGATGGPVSMLNNNVLANSDFMTGAFPAEYGNAYSGVFDLKMRNGNYEKHEFLGQIGFNGYELGAEGPVFKSNNSSYLINYRYSTMGLLSKMGISFGTGMAIPYYQDLTFKLNIPTKKFGKISVFGLGGLSDITFSYSERDTTKSDDNFYAYENRDVLSISKMGVIGVSHTKLISSSTYSKLTVGASTMINDNVVDSVSTVTNIPEPYVRMDLTDSRIFGNFYINKKINSHHNFRIGVNVKRIGMNLIDSVYNASYDRFVTIVDNDDFTWLYEGFIQWQYKLTDNLIFNPGIHYQQLALNNSSSVEPRLGIKWNLSNTQSVGLAYGLHSICQPLSVYFSQVELPDMSYYKPNENLDFTKSHHFVFGYNIQINDYLRFKTETYYQDIFQAVVEQEESSFSILNSNSFTRFVPDSLINGGSGYNYGIEFTIERFIEKGFYYLLTTSLYESKYKGSDGILRNTAFNGNYVVNALAGKEFELGSRKENAKSKKVITIDGKFTWAGGLRYTPVDVEKSIESGQTELDYTNPFSKQFEDYLRADIRVAFRLDGKKFSQEFVFDIQNFTNHKNPYSMVYNSKTGKEEMTYQLGLLPMVKYRIVF